MNQRRSQYQNMPIIETANHLKTQYSSGYSVTSQISANSSMFEEAKQARKNREHQVLRKIMQVQSRMQQNREKASQCLKFRPIKKDSKEN